MPDTPSPALPPSALPLSALPPSALPPSRLPMLDPVYARLQPLAYPLVRVVTGAFLMPHGAQKLFGFAGGDIGAVAAGFARMGLQPSLPLAYLVGAVEFFGGLCLVLGVFTRPAALACAILLGVAAFVAHLPNGWFWPSRGMEYPLFWMLLCIAVAMRGSGPLSVDAARGRDG